MSQYVPAAVGRTGPVRIGDAERDSAVAMLSEHFVAGRLTQEEFEERSDQATRARYADDLTPLFADLPDPAAAARSAPRDRRPPPFLWLAPVLMVGLLLTAVLLTAPWILFGLFCIVLFSRVNHRGHHHWHPRG